MSDTVQVAIIGGVVAIATAVLGYMTTQQNKKLAEQAKQLAEMRLVIDTTAATTDHTKSLVNSKYDAIVEKVAGLEKVAAAVAEASRMQTQINDLLTRLDKAEKKGG